MKKLKIITVAVMGVLVIVLIIMRLIYIDNGQMESAVFSVTGLKDGIGIECGNAIDGITVSVPNHIKPKDVISVSSDPNIAYLKLEDKDVTNDRVIRAKMIAISPGIAEIYVKSADGSAVSEKYSVNVIAVSEITASETEEQYPSEPLLIDGMVYVTEKGSKYHLSQKCAGDNSIAVTLEEAVDKGYLPCKNCAMNK